jgi:hypothetical protein
MTRARSVLGESRALIAWARVMFGPSGALPAGATAMLRDSRPLIARARPEWGGGGVKNADRGCTTSARAVKTTLLNLIRNPELFCSIRGHREAVRRGLSRRDGPAMSSDELNKFSSSRMMC